jgi:tetrahydromethanopterin S-methyltransferase subunit A
MLAFKFSNNLSNAAFEEFVKILKIAKHATLEDIKSAAEYVKEYDMKKKHHLKKSNILACPKNAIAFYLQVKMENQQKSKNVATTLTNLKVPVSL